MRRNIGWALASVVSVNLCGFGSALAADMAVKARPVVPPVVAYNWTGFYIGADVGGGWAQTDLVTFPTGTILGASPTHFYDLKGSGALGGGHVGYNWQVTPNWLLGVEADIVGTDIKGSGLGVPPFASATEPVSRNVRWLASARGRVGLTFDRVLLYATGGAAFGEINYTANNIFPLAPNSYPFAGSSTRSGWVAGAGVEWAINTNWLIRGEYLYYDLDSFGATVSGAGPALVPGATWTYNWGHTTVQTGRVGVSYKFGGPVVAKY